MKSSAEFIIRGDPIEDLFNDQASADSALLIRQSRGIAFVFDGHSRVACPHAKVLLDRAVGLIARSDSLLSPLVHGLEAAGTGCEPMALVVHPRGEAMIMPLDTAEATVRMCNPQPVLRHD